MQVTEMNGEQRGYLSYMVRLWQAESDGELVWRASVESPHTDERHAFAGLEALFAFLEEKTTAPASPEEPGERGR